MHVDTTTINVTTTLPTVLKWINYYLLLFYDYVFLWNEHFLFHLSPSLLRFDAKEKTNGTNHENDAFERRRWRIIAYDIFFHIVWPCLLRHYSTIAVEKRNDDNNVQNALLKMHKKNFVKWKCAVKRLSPCTICVRLCHSHRLRYYMQTMTVIKDCSTRANFIRSSASVHKLYNDRRQRKKRAIWQAICHSSIQCLFVCLCENFHMIFIWQFELIYRATITHHVRKRSRVFSQPPAVYLSPRSGCVLFFVSLTSLPGLFYSPFPIQYYTVLSWTTNIVISIQRRAPFRSPFPADQMRSYVGFNHCQVDDIRRYPHCYIINIIIILLLLECI